MASGIESTWQPTSTTLRKTSEGELGSRTDILPTQDASIPSGGQPVTRVLHGLRECEFSFKSSRALCPKALTSRSSCPF